MPNKLNFTNQSLLHFLKFLKTERKVTSFTKYNLPGQAILRHDVDLSIEKAYKVAQMEKKLGLTSTFFLMASSRTYNLLAQENQLLAKKISDWGYEIGLHFDPTVYGKTSKAQLQGLLQEAKILENIIGKKIQTYSLHNPSISKCFDVPNRQLKNVYDSTFFSQEYYVSDSQKIFKKDIFEFVRSTKGKTIQILIHPLHYHLKERDYAEIYSEAFARLINLTDKDFCANVTFRKDTRPNLLSHFRDYLAKQKKGSPKRSN